MKTLIGVLLFLTTAVTASGELVVNPLASRLTGKECEVWDEPQGIPHVRAADELTGLACMGFLHGRDRAWQMDFFRKTAEGRRSEVFGKGSLRTDFFMRLLALRERASVIFQRMKPEDQERLWAYAHGVSKGMDLAIKNGVYEFQAWGYLPEPWHPADTIALVLLQSFDQTKKSFQTQLDQVEWRKDHGEGAARLFDVDGLPWDTSILKEGEYPRAAARSSQWSMPPGGSDVALEDFPELAAGIGEGSNNWVLARGRSKTGNAWLANDPHLQLRHPPFWHWSHLEAGSLDVIGAALPGVPLIVSGANRHAAWGLTNSYLPVARLDYVPESELEGTPTERPLIWVRMWGVKLPFFFKTFRRTSHGWPVLPLPTPSGKALVLRWTGFDLGPEDFGGLSALMAAKTAPEIDHSLARVGVPSWNFVFADSSGLIGYRAVGRVPKFESKPDFGIPSRSLKELEGSLESSFPRLLSAEEMPHVLGPKRGFVVTANNRQWPPGAKFHSGTAHTDGYRAFRIEELLTQLGKHDLASVRRVQCDVQAVDARFFAPKLTALVTNRFRAKLNARETMVLEAFKDWDYEASLDCKVCGVYRRWMDRLLEAENVDETALYRKLLGEETPVDNEHVPLAIASPLAQNVYETFLSALSDLHVRSGDDLPRWGSLHLNEFEHLSDSDRFRADPIPTPGDDHSVNPGTSNWEDGRYMHSAGASQRLIVEMTSPPTVYSVLAGPDRDVEHRDLALPGGPWMKWRDCELEKRTFPVDWSKVQVARVAL